MRSVRLAAACAVALVTPVLVGCAGYRAGSFAVAGEPFVGERTTLGCLDVAVDVHRDPVAAGPVVHYQFGNRCDRAATVDLGRVRVTGRTRDGAEVALVPFDPHGEIRALPLDAHRAGRERIEYRTRRDLGGDVISVCVAVGDLGAGSPAPGRPPPTCRTVTGAGLELAEATP
ncbi:MAG: hypothetical protein HS111_03915 [Kofleriaceae bacterium]|nr:hypothetical protein [Kofleriaceae bacterium]